MSPRCLVNVCLVTLACSALGSGCSRARTRNVGWTAAIQTPLQRMWSSQCRATGKTNASQVRPLLIKRQPSRRSAKGSITEALRKRTYACSGDASRNQPSASLNFHCSRSSIHEQRKSASAGIRQRHEGAGSAEGVSSSWGWVVQSKFHRIKRTTPRRACRTGCGAEAFSVVEVQSRGNAQVARAGCAEKQLTQESSRTAFAKAAKQFRCC